MYTTLDFREVLNARRFIVGASPELKFRTTDEADIAHVVRELPTARKSWYTYYISFLLTSFKSPHSLRPMRARDTAYSHMPQTFSSLPVFCPVLSKGASKAKIVCFSNIFFPQIFCQLFFKNFFFTLII